VSAGDAGTTRWLSDDEQHVWRAYLEADRLLWEQLDDELQRSTGLALSEYEILVRLSERPGRSARMSEVADDVVYSRSRLTHTVARMEARGLLDRRPCPGDRRGVLAVMTEEGYRRLVAAAPTHVTGVREHLFDRLTPEEVAVLGRVMGKVRDHLRPPRHG
jgi:DNA-binding MarR family transcriptional regulator